MTFPATAASPASAGRAVSTKNRGNSESFPVRSTPYAVRVVMVGLVGRGIKSHTLDDGGGGADEGGVAQNDLFQGRKV